MNEIVNTFQKRPVFIIGILAFLFFIIYSWLFWPFSADQVKFTSPDETANYYFTTLFAEQNKLSVSSPVSQTIQQYEQYVRPRSTSYTSDDRIAPASFLGIHLLYGSLAKIFGTKAILFFTPFFAAAGIVFFYLLVRRIFSSQVAILSATLLAVMPPYWYYASRGMFHNILFVSALIAGLYFLVSAIQGQKQVWHWVGAGLCIGLAIITRTSELLWVSGVVAVILIIMRKNIIWKYAGYGLLCFIALCIPIFIANYSLYANPLSFGYTATADGGSSTTSNSNIITDVYRLILPFGIKSDILGPAVWDYLIKLFPWIGLPLVLGVTWLVKNTVAKKGASIFHELKEYYQDMSETQRLYYTLYVAVSVWLIIYYGSFSFTEHTDPSAIILGSSYARYWLPIFVFGLPLIVKTIYRIALYFRHKKIQQFVLLFLFVSIIVFSVSKTVADPLQGLAQLRQYIAEAVQHNDITVDATPEDAIIISGHADKTIFPERNVIAALPNDSEAREKLVRSLKAHYPLYYYYNPLDVDAADTKAFFEERGFIITKTVQYPNNASVLYQLH